MSSVLSLAWSKYLQSLAKQPLKTKAVTSAAIAGLSDIIAQCILKGGVSGHHNWKRTLAVFLYGFIWNGPSAHYWQKFMEIVFKGKSDVVTVLRKVLLDQLTYGPVCNILFMAYATMVLEGKSLQSFSSKVRRDYPLVQLNGWKVWPLAALINYKFVPLQFRVLFINCVALCWSIFLLIRARKMAQQQAGQKAANPGEAGQKQSEAAQKAVQMQKLE